MVRTVEKKYQVWLAGFYDDFNGARAIPDDLNSPSDSSYSALKSYFGSPMNGEAYLSPRFRFSIEERLQDTVLTSSIKIATSENQYLQNDGIFEWLTHDDTRLGTDDYEGMSQLQYPDGHVPNRYKFFNDTADYSEGYQRFINGHNSDASYIVPTGDCDSTIGRQYGVPYGTTEYGNKIAGLVGGGVETKMQFMQRAHLAGVYMGEELDATSTTVPANIIGEIYSPAKKPFLIVQSTRHNFSSHSPNTPTIIYDGHLNTRLDGDIFTARVALQTAMATSATGWDEAGIKFEIGFPVSEAGILSESGYTGTPAIDYTLDVSTLSYDTARYTTDSATNDQQWLDVDFKFNYTANTFNVYVNGTAVASNQTMSGGSTTTASDLYGFQMTVTNEESTSGNNGYVSYLMLDRVGLVRYLTDDYTGTDVHIQQLVVRSPVNGISICDVKVADDPDSTGASRGASSSDYVTNLRDIFIAASPLDWSLLIFASKEARIDRPVWRGEVDSFNINQRNNRSRVLTFKAKDSMSYLDRQVPLWDVGQKGLNTSEANTDYWSFDSQGFRNSMYLGADKLKLLDGNVGFDKDSNYKESSTQRTQLGSGHPIQMYNNENTYGPNDIEDYYEGFGIVGITKDTNTILVLQDTTHGLTTSSTMDVINTTSHNATGATISAVSGAEITTNITYTPHASAFIVYIGKYPAHQTAVEHGESTVTGPSNATPLMEKFIEWNNFTSNSPSANDPVPGGNPKKTYIYFVADPGLKVGDTFYISRKDKAGSVALNSAYQGQHEVTSVKKIRNYFTSAGYTDIGTISYLWVVRTDTDYAGSEAHGDYAGDDLLENNERFDWTGDTGQISDLTNATITALQKRAIHGRWMRDLPQSLWFKYHFGIIKRKSANEPTLSGLTGAQTPVEERTLNRVSASQTITSSTEVVQIDESGYNAAPNSGVAEFWSTPTSFGTGSTHAYTTATQYQEKFTYQGKVSSGGNYYLIGCRNITGSYTLSGAAFFTDVKDGITDKRLYVRFQDYEDDYKHIWLLWSDMRNNGNANADGLTRKSDFGLQLPIGKNYNFDLLFADQKDADGNLDKFASLKVGEDLDVWNVDATTDPFSLGPFSKPVDYDNKVSCTLSKVGASTFSADMRVTTSSPHGLAVGDYVRIFNSLRHDNFFQIASVTSTTFDITDGWNKNFPSTAIPSTDTGNTGGIFYAPVIGSHTDLSHYRDWEDKAGAFVVVDTSKFFNLNTHANGGKTRQSAGGRTDLTDYVVESNGERAGFPMLIDNYWTEAISSYQTTTTKVLQHDNQNNLISDATFATRGFQNGFVGLPVDDASIFRDRGIGKLVTVYNRAANEPNTEVAYFVWDGKLEVEQDYTIDTSGVSLESTHSDLGITVVTLTDSTATFQSDGLTRGMTVQRVNAAGTVFTYGTITDVPSETTLTVSSDGNWLDTDTFSVPPQLANIYVANLDHLDSTFIDADGNLNKASLPNLEQALWDVYTAQDVEWNDLGIQLGLGTTDGAENTPQQYEVHATVYSAFMLRLMMHIDGFYKSKNGGTYWDHDKFRFLWNAAIMDTWLPSATVRSVFDINNVPLTKMSDDSYGSVIDSRGKTILSIIADIQEKAGYGENGTYKSFSYLVGRDNRFEFRPKFNSGVVLNRDNMRVNNITSNLSGQITNVRVYYNKGASFADWPTTNLGDSTRWKIIEDDSVVNGQEALLVAQQEYNKRKNTPMQLKVTPILESDVEYKMIESGRYGYIADPYIALVGDADDYDHVGSWQRLGTGGVLFPGMVNALNGNMNVDMTDTQTRYGTSKLTTAGNITWDKNYYWYGSNSLSHAVQIVHIPNKTPLVSEQTNEHLRIWVDLKNQSGTDIDEAEFVVNVGDYSFTSAKAASLDDSKSVDVSASGFYEIDFPDNYGAVANAKIIFSFNAEYCRALLRHRCGDPTQTDETKANYILDSSVDNGSGSTNDDSIFPLGMRAYTEFYPGFRNGRKEWYAPRIHITNDLSYIPGTYAVVTDAGLGLNSETMVIQNVSWNVFAGRTEEVSFDLERDESIQADGVIGYLFPKTNGSKQTGSNIGSGSGNAYQEPSQTTPYPDQSADTVANPSDQQPDGATQEDTGTVHDTSQDLPLNDLDSGTFGRIKGRLDMPLSELSVNSRFSILGMKKPAATPVSFKGIEGMDVDIAPVDGTAALTADGYVFAGKGLMGTESRPTSQETTLQTQFVIPNDIVSNRFAIKAKVTHGALVATDTRAVLEVTATVKETGQSVTNTVKIKTGTKNQYVNLIPLTAFTGLKTPGNTVIVDIVRKAGQGDDTSHTTSVVLSNLEVKMKRAVVTGGTNTNQFSSVE